MDSKFRSNSNTTPDVLESDSKTQQHPNSSKIGQEFSLNSSTPSSENLVHELPETSPPANLLINSETANAIAANAIKSMNLSLNLEENSCSPKSPGHNQPGNLDHTQLETVEQNSTQTETNLQSKLSVPLPVLPVIHTKTPTDLKNSTTEVTLNTLDQSQARIRQLSAQLTSQIEESNKQFTLQQTKNNQTIHMTLPTTSAHNLPNGTTIGINANNNLNLQTLHKIVINDQGQKEYICHCEKKFTSSWSLTRHMRMHTGEKPFSCSFEGCHARFAQKSALTEHFRSHTGEKPYKCDLCDYKSARSGAIRRHITNLHKEYWIEGVRTL